MAAHRYWRINVLGSPAGSYTWIAEIAMASTYGGTNIITGGTASASAAQGSNVASNACDGNLSTIWQLTSSGTGTWTYDLGSGVTKEVAEVRLTAGSDGGNLNYNIGSFQLQYSDDGSTFTTVGEYDAVHFSSANQVITFPFLLKDTDAPSSGNGHRYWRVSITAGGSSSYVQFADISMATSVGGSNQIPTNGKAAIADSFYMPSSGAASPPTNATDGNASTGWTTSGASTGWWAYDFGAGNYPDIVELKITANGSGGGTYAPQNFALQWSNDEVTWTTKASYASQTFTDGQTKTFEAPDPLTGATGIITLPSMTIVGVGAAPGGVGGITLPAFVIVGVGSSPNLGGNTTIFFIT